ncbi:MAG: hypothetical protein RIC80_15835 [Cyclobacteriaceae bacterium]
MSYYSVVGYRIMKYWVLYNFVVGFAVYWLSNLVLWFPWSLNPTLGMILMLTVGTALWAIATYQCLVTYPGSSLLKAAAFNSTVLLSIAVVMDYIFFVLIRDAKAELYHPTTIYGYAFVVTLPFLMILLLKGKLAASNTQLHNENWYQALGVGLISFISLTLIILLGIEV